MTSLVKWVWRTIVAMVSAFSFFGDISNLQALGVPRMLADILLSDIGRLLLLTVAIAIAVWRKDLQTFADQIWDSDAPVQLDLGAGFLERGSGDTKPEQERITDPKPLPHELLAFQFHDNVNGHPTGLSSTACNLGYAALRELSIELLCLEQWEPSLKKFILEFTPKQCFMIGTASNVQPGKLLEVRITDGKRLIKDIDGISIDLNDLGYRHLVVRVLADGMHREEEVYFVCGGAETTHICAPPDERRWRIDTRQPIKETARVFAKTDDWRKLEEDFKAAPDEYHNLQLGWRTIPAGGEVWDVIGGTYPVKRFSATSRMAGKLLLSSRHCTSVLPGALLEIKSDEDRWYGAVKKLTSSFEIVGHGKQEDGSIVHYGKIKDPVKASAALCYELASYEGLA